MTLFEENGTVSHVATKARNVADVSGAGDTVIATLTMALAAGASVREASASRTSQAVWYVDMSHRSHRPRPAKRGIGLPMRVITDGRVIEQAELALIRKQLRTEQKKVVFTNGVFDIIHRGHVEYLTRAKGSWGCACRWNEFGCVCETYQGGAAANRLGSRQGIRSFKPRPG